MTSLPDSPLPPASGPIDVVVAGHICVDVIPTFEGPAVPLGQILIPGGLTKVGPVLAALGGAVSNTGLALDRLGVPVALMGKVGGDLFGQALLDILKRRDPRLARGMILALAEPSSYTIVIEPPGVDRIFLHCPGPNETFSAADLDLETVARGRIFHFGYPPIMRRMFENGGVGLEALLAAARGTGATISLDLSLPDPNTDAGRADWETILRRALPFVDLFVPSLDEIVYMLDRPRFDPLRTGEAPADGALLRAISDRLLAMGPAVVLLKLGDKGLFVRTSDDAARLAAMGRAAPADPAAWAGRELFAPCFMVSVGGTTGSGDCTIAGLLAALLRGLPVEDALTSALAVGACSVESPDATSGVLPWERVQARLAAGWPRHPRAIDLPGWRDVGNGVWAGPDDRGGRE